MFHKVVINPALPDEEKRNAAREELNRIYSSSDYEKAKERAEYILRIDSRNDNQSYPISCLLAGIAAVGITAGLAHMLIEYFSK